MAEGGGYSAGTIFLDVVPSFHNLQRRAERAGAEVSRAYSKGTKPALKGMVDSMEEAGQDGGRKAGDAFVRTVAARVKAAKGAIGDIDLEVNSTKATREIAKIKTALETVRQMSIDPDIDGADVIAKAKVIDKQIKAILKDQTIDLRTRTNLGTVRQELSEMGRQVHEYTRLTKRELEEAYRLNADHTKRMAAEQRKRLADQKRMLDEAHQLNKDFDTKRVESARRAQADLARLQTEALHQNRLFDQRRLAERQAHLRQYRDSELEALRSVERERARLRTAIARQEETAALSVRQPRDQNASTAARLAIAERYEQEKRLAEAAARARAASAARAAFAEVGSHQAAERAGKDHYDDVEDAARRSAAARVALARLAAAQERAAARASGESFGERLSRNTGQAANSFRVFNGYLLFAVTIGPLLIPVLAGIAAGMGAIAVMATAAVAGIAALALGFAGIGGAVGALANLDKERRKQATGSGAGAPADLRGLRDAQEALARAREDAGRRIAAAARQQEDAERSLTRAVRDAAEANRDLVDARRRAAEDLEDLNNRLAGGLLSERQAQFSLQEASFRYNNVLEDDQATSREKEVARLEFEQAQQSLKELQISNRRLERDVAEANAKGVEGSDQVTAAKERILDADEQVQRAERDLADAHAEAARARVEESRTMADAERRVADAMVDLQTKSVEAGVAGSAAMDQLREAMLGLSPAGQEFARFLYGLKPLLDEIRGVAQQGLLPGVQTMLGTLIETYGPGFVSFIGTIAKVLGEMAVAAGTALTNPAWQNFFGMMAQYAPTFLAQFARIMELFAEFFRDILIAFAPFAVEFGEALIGLLEGAAEWANGLGEDAGFAKFLDFVREVGPKVLTIIGLLATVLLKVFEGMEPYIDRLADTLIGFLGWLAEQDPETLAQWALGLMAIVGAIQALAGVIAVVSSVTGLITGLAGVFGLLGGGAAAGGGAAVAAGAAATNPVGWIVLGVAAAIAAVVGLVWWLNHLYETNENFRRGIELIWQAIMTAFQIAYDIVIAPVLNAINTAIEWLMPLFQLFGRVISDVWGFIAGIFELGWQVVSRVFNAIAQIWTFVVGPAFRALYDDYIKPVWEQYIQPIFDAMGRFIEDHIKPAWERGVALLGTIWEGLKELVAAPIRWVIETVINNGLIGAFNSLASKVPGMTPIDPVAIPAGLMPSQRAGGGGGRPAQAFASGGILPGYTPGRDVHRFYSPTVGTLELSGGEGILRPEAVRALGPGWIHGINRAARTGGLTRYLGGFADGGILGNFGQMIGSALSSATDVISGAVSNVAQALADPAAALRGVVDGLYGLLPGSGDGILGATKIVPYGLANGLGGMLKGFFDRSQPGEGTAVGGTDGGGIGSQAMVSLLRAAFPNIGITSTFRPGAITAVGTKSYHGKNRAVDMSPRMDVFNWILGNYPDSAELLFSPAGMRQILRRGKQGNTSGVTKAMHYNHVHWAYKDGGVIPNLYDNGGYLPPGLSVVANKTGKPEPILTDRQWDALSKRQATAGGDTINIGEVVGDEKYADRIVSKIQTRKRDAAVLASLGSIGDEL